MEAKMLKKYKLPDTSGVYFFKKGREVIYIGKATSLQDRVKSYFSKDLLETRGPIVVKMVQMATSVDYQTTDNVLEALILEAYLIKKHQPKYNTKEKSNKSFNYVCITKEELPKIVVVRERGIKISRTSVFGPFTSASQLREAMKIIRPIFPFLDDKSVRNYKFYKQLHLVPDVLNEDGIQVYKNNIKNLKLFFQGKKKQVMKNLQKEMKKYAKVHEFERAGETKRQLFALKHINDIALLKKDGSGNNSFSSGPRFPGAPTPARPFRKAIFTTTRIEAYDVAHMGGKNMVGVMVVVVNGEATKSEYKKFKIRSQRDANDTGALREVLERRLVHKEWEYPDLIVVDGGVAQMNVATSVLKNLKINIPVVSVVKDATHKPKNILEKKENKEKWTNQHKDAILLANSEAHRFAITYHKNMRNKNFLHR